MDTVRPVMLNDEQFKHAADALPLLVWASNADGHYYFFNSALKKFTGHKPGEKGDAWMDSVQPEDRNLFDKHLNSVEAKEEFQRIYRLKRYDGDYCWISERCVPRYHSDGAFAGYAGYGMDVTKLLHDPRLEGNVSNAEAGLREDNLNEELAATNEELSATNEELMAANEELKQSQQSLADLNRELEDLVAARTKALSESEQIAISLNKRLARVNDQLAATNEELSAANEELSSTNEELVSANNELAESREEIMRSEKLFKSIAVNIPKSLIIVIGKDHRFIAVEGDLMVKLGYDSQKYVGKHPTEVAPMERYEASKHLYERVLAGEQFTIDRKGQNGEDFRVEFVPLRNDNEVYAGLIIALDITDIKQAEEKSAKLAAIITSSDDAIISKTLESIVTSWNAAAERMFGWTEKEMIGQSITRIIPDERQDEEPHIIEQLRKGHRVDHFETKRITKDGRILDVSVTISPIKDSEGHIIGASKIARDISEKKLDEQRKNDFIGMVSHELKTPLTSLTAILQLLQKKLERSEDSHITGPLHNANRQVKKMANMINGFLNISRLESGKMPMIKKDFILNELVWEAVEETRLVGADQNIRFNGEEAVNIHADRDKIGSVILNLLSNATKYSSKTSPIDVTCKIRDGKVRVSVKDQGIGIEPGDLKKLFDRYYRVENPDTQHISGFGIGLYLSAEIIRQHQGEIWAESAPGKGSTFHFTLPLS